MAGVYRQWKEGDVIEAREVSRGRTTDTMQPINTILGRKVPADVKSAKVVKVLAAPENRYRLMRLNKHQVLLLKLEAETEPF